MDVHGVAPSDRMDYNDLEHMEPKHGKALPCQDDRFDSGLESLKEDELVTDLEHLRVSEELVHDYEPWRGVVTDDGDT